MGEAMTLEEKLKEILEEQGPIDAIYSVDRLIKALRIAIQQRDFWFSEYDKYFYLDANMPDKNKEDAEIIAALEGLDEDCN